MKITQALGYVIRDAERKPLRKIGAELIRCALTEREVPLYYFTSLLHQKGSGDYQKFIGHKKIRRITAEYFRKDGANTELEDKHQFSQVLSRHKIATPTIIARSRGKTVTFAQGNRTIEDGASLKDLTHELIRTTDDEAIFVKPVEANGGKHTFILTHETKQTDMERLFALMGDVDFVFQERIVQNDQVSRVYAASINTLRIHTYRHPRTNTVDIISALMRFGSGGNIVDNGSSSGFFVPVDLHTWSLQGNGKSYLHSGGRTLVRHPDSGVTLDGFKIPFGNEIENLIQEVTPLFDQELIGWDIALTNQGPVVIEGNQNPHLIMAQVACGGLKNNRGFSKVFRDFV